MSVLDCAYSLLYHKYSCSSNVRNYNKPRPRAETSKCVIVFMNEVTDPIIDAEYIVVNVNLSIIMCQNYHNFF